MLQREVEVGHAGGADRVDQLVGEVGRVEVEQPHPVDPCGHGLDEGTMARVPTPLVAPVAGEVLGHEHDLRPPASSSTSARIDSTVRDALRAAEAGDGAEAAGPVAALGHLHVGPRRRAGRPGQVEQVEAGQRSGRAGLAAEGDGHAEAGDARRPRAGPRPARRRSARPCSR